MVQTAHATLPQPGDLVVGKYRVERVLARGGMGVVLAARHEALDQRVAIKFLLPEISGVSGAAARFVREAQASARIQSEHVCRVFDVGTTEDGAPYMVMELLDGTDLGAELDRRGTLPIADAVSYVIEALDAIIEAHRRGIIHRDLKPPNLFLSRRDDGRVRVKVLDFGISKIDVPGEGPGSVKLTSTHAMLGSPSYMSPEQVRSSKDVDARSDLWSLGVILYECLAGGTLFGGQTLGEVFSKIREDAIPPLTAARPDVPAELVHIVGRCLQRKPDERIASAAELREALLSFLGRYQGGVATRSSVASVPPRESSPTEAAFARTGLAVSSSGSLPPPMRASQPNQLPPAGRSRAPIWAAGLGVVLCASVGTYALLVHRTSAGQPLVADPRTPTLAAAGDTSPATMVVPAEPARPPEGAPTLLPAPIASASALPVLLAPAHPAASRGHTGKGIPVPSRSPADDLLGSQH